ncbi:MAG TPA: protein kinase, partial [Vicinamibacteria bacterium]
MSLTVGEKLGSYEILAPLGAGGMGQVYRARDAKLGREVAIKVLPEEFTQHPRKLARFEREARLLAALNHPGIATLYGVEEWSPRPGGPDRRQPFLVMELVEGETLAERIARGPLPVTEALTISQ